jgi:hypothetical protein
MTPVRSAQNALLAKGLFPEAWLRPTVNYIVRTQRPSGCIPWFEGGKADPWDHIEAAMGLSIGGEFAAAERAYLWLAQQQLDDGSWWAHYEDDLALDTNHRETNFIAYIATGVWHHYLITQDRAFLQRFFPVVNKAIDCVLRYQAPSGEIYWALDAHGNAQKDALVTACASVYKSLDCAILSAKTLGLALPGWEAAYHKLGHALRHRPDCFDRTWESKAHFSMDWFYPVLAGVVQGPAAQDRLASRWPSFIEDSVGCRCVSHEPWVTVAESCELTLALLAAGEPAKASRVFSWLHQFRDGDGGYWTGYNFRDKVIWPQEKTTWTAGAILLAADALAQYSPASSLFVAHNALAQSAAQGPAL